MTDNCVVLISDESSRFLKWNKVISLKHFHSIYQILVFFFFFFFGFRKTDGQKSLDPRRQASLGFPPSVLCTGLPVSCSVDIWMFPGLLFCLSKGRKGPGQALSSQDPCSERIRKSSPLKPNCELNTTCCRNLKISGLTAVSKTTDANALESCQSEILFESQVTFFILLDRHEPWAAGHSTVSRKAYALYSCIIYLLFYISL